MDAPSAGTRAVTCSDMLPTKMLSKELTLQFEKHVVYLPVCLVCLFLRRELEGGPVC